MKKPNANRLRAALPGILLVLLVAGCILTPGIYLKWSAVDTAALMKSPAGNEKFNTIRVSTFGPYAEQIFGYFLYRDGIEVVTGGGASIQRLGKLTPGEVTADYARVVNNNMYNPRVLVTREILRGSSVVGYTVTDLKLDVDIWDITPAGQGSPIIFRLDYKDRRYINSGGDSQGEVQSGR
jgi:hypothetical protein